MTRTVEVGNKYGNKGSGQEKYGDVRKRTGNQMLRRTEARKWDETMTDCD